MLVTDVGRYRDVGNIDILVLDKVSWENRAQDLQVENHNEIK